MRSQSSFRDTFLWSTYAFLFCGSDSNTDRILNLVAKLAWLTTCCYLFPVFEYFQAS